MLSRADESALGKKTVPVVDQQIDFLFGYKKIFRFAVLVSGRGADAARLENTILESPEWGG